MRENEEFSHEQRDRKDVTESESIPIQATRQTVLRGTGVAGFLAMGLGSASAFEGTFDPAIQQVSKQTAENTWEYIEQCGCGGHVVRAHI